MEDVVVITGGGGGMGTECVSALAQTGRLLVVDLDQESVGRGVDAAHAVGAEAHACQCDITNPDDVARLARAISDLGSFHSLVHTAGLSPNMADGRRVLDVDLVGTARVLDALLPLVNEGTAAICIASIAGYSDLGSELNALLDDPLTPGFLDQVAEQLTSPLDGEAGYVLAKRGVLRMCERMSAAWGERGGRLISVSPGLMDTGMGRLELQNQDVMQVMIDITPIKRPGAVPLPGRPQDIASLVSFLCSDAASFISGCDIRVDGGLIGAARHMGFGG